MVNLKTEKKPETETNKALEGDQPEYPWGLCITLNTEVLQKLGLTDLPAVGSSITLSAIAQVQSTSQYNEQDGDKNTEVRLQITDMEINKPTADPAKTMFPNMS